jgi:hypothetical protein
MKYLFLIASILFLFSSETIVFAQKKLDWSLFPMDVKWGVFSERDLAIKSVSFEPEAKVVCLFEEGKAGVVWDNDTFQVLGMYAAQYYRYKVLDDNVAGFGDIVIPYYQAGELHIEEIKGIEAQVSYLEGGERKTYRLGQEDIKQIDFGNGFGEYRLIFPKVFRGSILEYRYLKTDRVYYSLEGWVFQGEHPKLRSKFTFDVPNFLQYQLIMPSGRVKSSMNQSEERDRFSWTLTDVKAFHVEPYISSPMDYLERVEGFLAVDATQEPSTLYSTWEKLGDQVMELKEYRSFLKSVSYKSFGFKEDVFFGESKDVIARKLYDHISTNFTLEPSLYPLPSKTLPELLRTKKGNHLDIHLLLIAALREYEIEAEPVLVNELHPLKRSFLIPSPNIDQFSSSLVRLELDGGAIYLDATDATLPFGLIPLQKLVEKGFLLTKSNSALIDLKHHFDSKTDLEITLGLDSVGNLEYREKLSLTQLQVLAVLNSLNSDQEEEASDDIRPYNITHEDHFREEGFVRSSFHLPINGSDGELILLDPFTFSGFATNPFIEESRTYPLEFGFPITEKMRFEVKLPEGYLLDEFPESVSLQSETGDLMFNFQVKKENEVLHLVSELRIDVGGSVSQGRYKEVRNFFQIVSEKLSEPIVVVRKPFI